MSESCINIVKVSGIDHHYRFLSPSIRGPSSALLRFGTGLLRMVGLVLALVMLANLAHLPSAPYLGQALPLSIAAAFSPSDDSCPPGDACCHDHWLCCLSSSCSFFAPAIVALDFRHAGSADVVASADMNLGSGDPFSPFHPPKLLALA